MEKWFGRTDQWNSSIILILRKRVGLDRWRTLKIDVALCLFGFNGDFLTTPYQEKFIINENHFFSKIHRNIEYENNSHLKWILENTNMNARRNVPTIRESLTSKKELSHPLYTQPLVWWDLDARSTNKGLLKIKNDATTLIFQNIL